MTAPLPGDFALTRIRGLAGAFVGAGQWFIGDGAPVHHALVYIGGGYVVQAMPGGAEMIPMEDASPVVAWSTGRIPLTAAQRVTVAEEATNLVGTPYSFLDYASIGLAHLGLRPRWLRDYVASTGHMICSQLVDEVYRRARVDLFDDDRIPGDVTPGDLWRLIK
ncbi:hypothetical protein [Streptomyces sp. NPDC048603]|uniref:hypothetical protein n=1 Tax=Streptomyces sp. NPDC048603 TaxID=3365577 RepID=UPI0037216632